MLTLKRLCKGGLGSPCNFSPKLIIGLYFLCEETMLREMKKCFQLFVFNNDYLHKHVFQHNLCSLWWKKTKTFFVCLSLLHYPVTHKKKH